jgi:predicted TPR repeat methyltransferase
MIEKARTRQIYDNLWIADLETALSSLASHYDLILAADTLVYLGDLERVFEVARGRLQPDGYFLFTVEKADGNGFDIGPKRRWRHSDAYIRALAEAAQFSVAGLVAATPRHEANQPVPGFAVALAAS